MKLIKQLSMEKYVALAILIVGLIMSVMIPTWQTPDEYTHLDMIGRSIGLKNFGENILDDIPFQKDRLEAHYEEKVDMEEFEEGLSQDAAYSVASMLPKKLSISIIKHLPSAIGVLLGICLGLPSFWVLQLGELFALLFYAGIVYLALRITPVKKEALAIVALLPMAIQQASSLNYDATVLPLCYLLVAYIFSLKHGEDQVGLREVMTIFILWLLISYIKAPYTFLILLILTIPLSKFAVNLGFVTIDETWIKRLRIPAILLMGIGIVCIAYVFRHNKWIQIVYGYVMEWKRGVYLLKMTGVYWTKFLMTSTVGDFGYLDAPMSFVVVVFVFLFLGVFALTFSDSGRKLQLRKWDYFVMISCFCILCVFITIALTDHTIMITLYGDEWAKETYEIRTALYQIPYIGGVQGRYYIPTLPVLIMMLPDGIRVKKNWRYLALVIGEVLIYAYTFRILMLRYWIQ